MPLFPLPLFFAVKVNLDSAAIVAVEGWEASPPLVVAERTVIGLVPSVTEMSNESSKFVWFSIAVLIWLAVVVPLSIFTSRTVPSYVAVNALPSSKNVISLPSRVGVFVFAVNVNVEPLQVRLAADGVPSLPPLVVVELLEIIPSAIPSPLLSPVLTEA